MTNAYCDLATLKSAGALNITGGLYDRRLLALLEEASRVIDGFCNRHFYLLHTTRRFETAPWTGPVQQLLVPDLARADTVRAASVPSGPAPEEPDWQSIAHTLCPLDAAPDRHWGRPYTRITLGPLTGPAARRGGPTLIQVAGRWGYREVTEDTGCTLSAPATATATRLSVSGGGGLSPGQTLVLGDEQLYVHAVDGTQGSVERGINGSTAAAHESGTAVHLRGYPGPVTEACLLLASELWHGRHPAAVASEPGPARSGAPPPSGLGREVEALLSSYRKLAL